MLKNRPRTVTKLRLLGKWHTGLNGVLKLGHLKAFPSQHEPETPFRAIEALSRERGNNERYSTVVRDADVSHIEGRKTTRTSTSTSQDREPSLASRMI